MTPKAGKQAYQYEIDGSGAIAFGETVGLLTPGDWTASVLVFSEHSWAPAAVPFRIEPGLTSEVPITLREGRLVRGRVLGSLQPGRHQIRIAWRYQREPVPRMGRYCCRSFALPHEFELPFDGCVSPESTPSVSVFASAEGFDAWYDVRSDGVFGLVGVPPVDLRVTLERDRVPVTAAIVRADATACELQLPDPSPALTLWVGPFEQQAERWVFHVRSHAEGEARRADSEAGFVQIPELAPGGTSVFAVGAARDGGVLCAYMRTTRSGAPSDLALRPVLPGRFRIQKALAGDGQLVPDLEVTALGDDGTVEIPGTDRRLSPDGLSGPLPPNLDLVLRFTAAGCEPADIRVRLDAGMIRDLGEVRLRRR